MTKTAKRPVGKPRSLTDKQVKEMKAMIELGIPKTVVARRMNISRRTLYDYLPR